MSDLNEEYYPFKIRVEKDKDSFYLIEENSEKEEVYRYSNTYLSQISLIIWSLKYSVDFTNNSFEEVICGKATPMNTGSWEYDTRFSIFGSDREIKFIDIKIQSCNSKIPEFTKQGFFISILPSCGYLEKEFLCIHFFISNLKFKIIKTLLEKKLIKRAICSLETSRSGSFLRNINEPTIEGLYSKVHDEFHYKFLLDQNQVINKEELPSYFKSMERQKYYEFPFSFHIGGEELIVENNIEERK